MSEQPEPRPSAVWRRAEATRMGLGLVLWLALPTGVARADNAGWFIGAGLGGGSVSRQELQRVHEVGLDASIRLGKGLSSNAALMLESEVHHVSDGELGAEFAVPTPVYRTRVLLVSLELGTRFFVRPGVGIGHHRFAVGADCDESGDICRRSQIFGEMGPCRGPGGRLSRSVVWLVDPVSRRSRPDQWRRGQHIDPLLARRPGCPRVRTLLGGATTARGRRPAARRRAG